VTAGFAAILNAITPMWTALIGWAWLRQPVRPLQWLGLALGIAGVVVLVWGRSGLSLGGAEVPLAPAIVAALFATAAYGLAANYTRARLADLSPLVIATGSQIGAAAVLLLPALLTWPDAMPDARAWLAALALGIACTGLAYLLYFRLIARVGAMRAASVTFLIPLFATAWGALFLGEALTLQMLAGGAVVLAGTALALGLLPRRAPE
jgi:drug/metabolite transporter (DMT)-like permease